MQQLLANPLLVITVIFILSLVGAIVLFKFLKSTAIIKKTEYQASGAIAGFLLIFGMLYGSFYQLSSSEPEQWTVTGTVKRKGDSVHENIMVRQIPPKPSALTDSSGSFRMYDVKVLMKEGWPALYVESEGYYPKTIEISESNIRGDKIDVGTIELEVEPKSGGHKELLTDGWRNK